MRNSASRLPKKKEQQDNIGYENTKTGNDRDDLENRRVQSTDTRFGEGPKDNDTEGLRSESDSKSPGKKSGHKEQG